MVSEVLIVHIALVALCPDADIRLRVVDVENLIYNLTLLHAKIAERSFLYSVKNRGKRVCAKNYWRVL